MGQKKGHTGNPNGRPKGTPNKVASGIKIWLSELIDKNRKQIEQDLESLEPKERLQIFEKFMQYTVPKMQSTESKIDFNMLTEDQINIIINELQEELQDENSTE